MKENKIELLAPAGDINSFNEAINNGANAIYLSGNKFGARAYATNFSNQEIADAIKTAHLLDVKVYVTVNTLIKDDEMNNVLSFVNFLYENGVDGILIQDIGLAYILRTIFPLLPLHASTQMNIHSVSQAKYLKEMGFKRIVLGRECDINLIKEIKENVDIEIEVFCHGALCMSYSGQCLMSSFIGKRSGNRGRCAGACRLQYELVKENDVYEKEVIGDKAYYLSLKDLYTLDKIKELKDAHVDSLKIEGRLKRFEYVGLVTKAYREAIDGYINIEKRKYELQEMFNREFTCGHLFNEKNSLQTNIITPNHIGVKIGHTIRASKNYIYIKLDSINKKDTLKLTDSIRITDNKTDNKLEDGITLSRIDVYDNNFKNIKKANEVHYNDIIGFNTHIQLKENMDVLKTTTVSLLKEYEQNSISINKKIPINGIIYLKENRLGLELTKDDITINCLSDIEVEKSENSIIKERIKEQISKINSTYFYFNELKVNIPSVFLPIKDINALRRNAIDILEQAIIESKKTKYEKEKFKRSVNEYNNEPSIYCKVRTKDQYEACISAGIKNIITEEKALKNIDGIIYMNPRVVEDNSGIAVKEKISSVYQNIMNSYSVYFMHNQGIEIVGLSVELNRDEIQTLVYNYETNFMKKPNLMMMVYGHYESMIMKHCLINKFCDYKQKNCMECMKHQYYLKDKLDYYFPLIRTEGINSSCNLKLLNSTRLHLVKYLRNIIDMGINTLLMDFTIESKNETFDVVSNYLNAFNGDEYIRDIENVTYGHYKESIE